MRYMDTGIDDFMHRIESHPPGPVNGHSANGTSSSPYKSMEENETHPQHISFPSPGECYQILIPGMTARGGSLDVMNTKREGNIIIPGASASSSGNSDGDTPRQTPAQDMNSAMIEASQEIRQLREQEAQAALTDRVKRLSKTGESSDKDRFSRSLQFAEPPMIAIGSSSTAGPSSSSTLASTGISAPFTEEPVMDMEADFDTSTDASPHPIPLRSASVPSPQEVVRQIAHRVSQQLREAQLRGEPTLDYHTLIAQEIVKEQKAGILPVSPPGSRHNSVDKAKISTNRAALPPIAPTTHGQDKDMSAPKESPLTSLSGLESTITATVQIKDKGKGKEKEKDKDKSHLLGRQRSLPMLMRRLSGRARADKTVPGDANGTGATASSGGSVGSERGRGFPKWMKLSKK